MAHVLLIKLSQFGRNAMGVIPRPNASHMLPQRRALMTLRRFFRSSVKVFWGSHQRSKSELINVGSTVVRHYM